MDDPWGRCDLDDWTADDILANALLDPLPAGLGWDEVRADKGNFGDIGDRVCKLKTSDDSKDSARAERRKARRESRRARRRRLNEDRKS